MKLARDSYIVHVSWDKKYNGKNRKKKGRVLGLKGLP
jgi:hypothetical protein